MFTIKMIKNGIRLIVVIIMGLAMVCFLPNPAQARRALENETITIVAHQSGYVHTIYDMATMDEKYYAHFTKRLRDYLKASLDDKTIVNFLRHSRDLQKCFQLRWPLRGVDNYISAERLFAYEHGSPYRINDRTRDKLLAEIDDEEFQVAPLRDRIIINDLEVLVIVDGGKDNRRPASGTDILSSITSFTVSSRNSLLYLPWGPLFNLTPPSPYFT